MFEDLNINWEKVFQIGLEYGWLVIQAILIYVIGIRVIGWVTRLMAKGMEKREMEPSLRTFLKSLVRNILMVLLIVTILSTVGVEATSFIAIIGAAGLAIGLSLQGTLQNFAGGVVILMLKPFKIGDFIEASGTMGTVKSIQIFTTILTSPDNKRIIVPNGQLSNSQITNFSSEDTRRVDMVFGIGYSDNIPKAKEILKKILKDDPRVLEDPAPAVIVGNLGDSSVDFNVRPWVRKEDYWGVFGDITEKVKLTFDKEGISIPFPQRDVHLYQQK